MSHTHSHSHAEGGHAAENLNVAFWLNAVFVVIELVGGLLTNSISILSDALHDFGDCLSIVVAIVFQRKSTHGCSPDYTYGYKRYSLLGGVFLSGVLTVSSVFVIYAAIGRLIHPQVVSAPGMFALAIVGVIINGSAALKVKRGSSLNERAVFLHIMEDVLGWVAVLVVGGVMLIVNLPILDPILSIAIALWVLTNAFRNLRAAFRIMLQATPDDVDLSALKGQLTALPGVESVHDLHLWSLDGERHVMTLHVVSESADAHTLKEQVEAVAEPFHIHHVTMELESATCPCSQRNCGE